MCKCQSIVKSSKYDNHNLCFILFVLFDLVFVTFNNFESPEFDGGWTQANFFLVWLEIKNSYSVNKTFKILCVLL